MTKSSILWLIRSKVRFSIYLPPLSILTSSFIHIDESNVLINAAPCRDQFYTQQKLWVNHDNEIFIIHLFSKQMKLNYQSIDKLRRGSNFAYVFLSIMRSRSSKWSRDGSYHYRCCYISHWCNNHLSKN